MVVRMLIRAKGNMSTLSNRRQINPELRKEFLIFRNTLSAQKTKKQQQKSFSSVHHNAKQGVAATNEIKRAPDVKEGKPSSLNLASLKPKSDMSYVEENPIESEAHKTEPELLNSGQTELEEALPWESSVKNINITETDISLSPEIKPYKHSEDPSLMAHCPACGEILGGKRCPNFYFHLTE
jgi:hypothetical protein